MQTNLRFEDFYNQQHISSGTFGTVHKVQNKSTNDKQYAVKTMTFQSGKNQAEILKEIEIWQSLQSLQKPNSLPNFYGSFNENLGLTGTSFHLVFDYHPKSLNNIIEDLKKKKIPNPFPFQKLHSYAHNLINTLAYLQSMKICHRDLKPANLLLDESENQIYLIDLGESKEILTYAPKKTKAEITIAGSPKYFSPELDAAFQSNDKNVKLNPFKSDVFSFALICLKLGTLKIPKKDADVNVWEKNIRKTIREFKKLINH